MRDDESPQPAHKSLALVGRGSAVDSVPSLPAAGSARSIAVSLAVRDDDPYRPAQFGLALVRYDVGAAAEDYDALQIGLDNLLIGGDRLVAIP